jgi:hypothetical protein
VATRGSKATVDVTTTYGMFRVAQNSLNPLGSLLYEFAELAFANKLLQRG